MLKRSERQLLNLVPALIVPTLIGRTRESHQLRQRFACGATEYFSEKT